MSLPLAKATEPAWRGTRLCSAQSLHGAGECLGQLLCLLVSPFAFSTQMLGETLAAPALSPQERPPSGGAGCQGAPLVLVLVTRAGFVLVLLIQC